MITWSQTRNDNKDKYMHNRKENVFRQFTEAHLFGLNNRHGNIEGNIYHIDYIFNEHAQRPAKFTRSFGFTVFCKYCKCVCIIGHKNITIIQGGSFGTKVVLDWNSKYYPAPSMKICSNKGHLSPWSCSWVCIPSLIRVNCLGPASSISVWHRGTSLKVAYTCQPRVCIERKCTLSIT